jgi:hypothetical protein
MSGCPGITESRLANKGTTAAAAAAVFQSHSKNHKTKQLFKNFWLHHCGPRISFPSFHGHHNEEVTRHHEKNKRSRDQTSEGIVFLFER